MKDEALIVLRCLNDAWVVEQTLEAIFEQKGTGFRVVAIDSGSTDGSVDILRRFPLELVQIPAGTYVPGRVLNQGMAMGEEPYGVFVNSDCTPQHDTWLVELLEPMRRDPAVAAVYGRQIARPNAHPLVVKDYERAFGDGRIAAAWRHMFSMASSAIRRSVWQEHPFDPEIRYSEDMHWSWHLKRAGRTIVYAPHSIAMHSHNYTLAEMRRRYAGEGKADSRIYPSSQLPQSWARGVLVAWASEVARDLSWCARNRHVRAALDAPIHRWIQRSSYWSGLRQGTEALHAG